MADSGFFLDVGILASRLRDFGDIIPSNGETNMRVAATHLEGEIRVRSPVDTGHLRASYSHVVEKEGDKVIGHVGTNTEYALQQEMYYTPHVRPALDANQDRLIKIMGEDTLSDAISRL